MTKELKKEEKNAWLIAGNRHWNKWTERIFGRENNAKVDEEKGGGTVVESM